MWNFAHGVPWICKRFRHHNKTLKYELAKSDHRTNIPGICRDALMGGSVFSSKLDNDVTIMVKPILAKFAITQSVIPLPKFGARLSFTGEYRQLTRRSLFQTP